MPLSLTLILAINTMFRMTSRTLPTRHFGFQTVVTLLLICLAGLVYPSVSGGYSRLSKEEVLDPDSVTPPGSLGNERQGEGGLLSDTRQLTFEGRRAGEGYFSQDGSMMVFQSEREPGNPFFQIYLMSLESGDTRRISPGYGKTTCAWIHPNRKRVLFASTHLDPNARKEQDAELKKRASGKARRYSWDYDEHYDIFEAALDGRPLKNLTRTLGYDAEGSWSPDGKLIAFSSNRHAYTETLSPQYQVLFERDRSVMLDIYVMNADGTNVRRLTREKGYDGGPFFSPDGKKIVWRRFSEDGATAEIFTMNVDGTDQKQITHLGVMSWAPFFHPSGDYLIFSTNLRGFKNIELYLVDSEGQSEPVRVTTSDSFDGLPSFSPEGDRLSWTSNRTSNKRSQIFLSDWSDAEARRLLGLALTGRKLSGPTPILSPPTLDLSRTVPAISRDDIRHHISILASEGMEGRLTGTEGARRATDYVASVYQSLGLEPAGDDGTFFQSFEFTAGVSLGRENRLVLSVGDAKKRLEFTVDKDWQPLAFSKTGLFGTTGLVFTGYGIVAPATAEHKAYDSFAHLEVKNRWVLVFRYLPEGISQELRQHLTQYASLRHKAMMARDLGARGLIVVSGPNSKVKDELVKLSFDVSLAGTSIGVISVSDDIAERLLETSGKRLKELQDTLDTGQSMIGFQVPNVTLEATIDIDQEKRTGRNVLARLNAGKTPGRSAVVIGAHVDHLGQGLGAGSLARGDEKGLIHYGADDNASGVAGVLEIAEYLQGLKARDQLTLRRDILFAAWSGEELGLLGSSYFTRTFGAKKGEPSTLTPAIAAYLNMDMIGRLDKALVVHGVGSSSAWSQEIERSNVPIGLPIVTQADSHLPTDATAFYLKGVPILNAFTGAHKDYHTPRDTADRINYPGAEKIARFMASVTRSLATREGVPDYSAVKRIAGSRGRERMRLYLGTIPDYARGDVTGVKLSGVVKGGPADRAGVREGDTIVELASKKIENIYDYTYALDGLKIDIAVEMVVLRGDRRIKLTVKPESRE